MPRENSRMGDTETMETLWVIFVYSIDPSSIEVILVVNVKNNQIVFTKLTTY